MSGSYFPPLGGLPKVAGIGRRIGKWVPRCCAKRGDLETSRPVGARVEPRLATAPASRPRRWR
jgi:hypothetical protein